MSEPIMPAYSKRSIIEGSIAAFVVAFVVLLIGIMPAEYGIDPTGIGEATGLTALAEARQSIRIAEPVFATTTFVATAERISLNPGEGVEFKLLLQAGSALVYSWTSVDPLYFDFHGEPTEEDGKRFLPFKSYKIDTATSSSGYIVPEFTGKHGWFWRNDGMSTQTIILNTAGFYEVIGVINRSK